MSTLNWAPEEIESLTLDTLERAFIAGNLDPLLINDGHVVGCENTQEVEDCGEVLHCNA